MAQLTTQTSFKIGKNHLLCVYKKMKAKKYHFAPSFLSWHSIISTYLDVKLQVLVHGIDVVKDVVRDPWDDSHELRVMELPLVGEKHRHAGAAWEREGIFSLEGRPCSARFWSSTIPPPAVIRGSGSVCAWGAVWERRGLRTDFKWVTIT